MKENDLIWGVSNEFDVVSAKAKMGPSGVLLLLYKDSNGNECHIFEGHCFTTKLLAAQELKKRLEQKMYYVNDVIKYESL